jgi:hypothetical protein
MGFSVATILVAELLTIGVVVPLTVTVSGVPENPVPVIVSWFPEMVTALIVEAEATAQSRSAVKV